MECCMESTLPTWTPNDYVNALARSLIESNPKIWLNINQINQLSNDALRAMLISDDGGETTFGKFIVFLHQTMNATVNRFIQTRTFHDCICISTTHSDSDLKVSVLNSATFLS